MSYYIVFINICLEKSIFSNFKYLSNFNKFYFLLKVEEKMCDLQKKPVRMTL